jgi:hypothetical protein
MEISGHLHTPAALPQGKRPWYPLDRRLGESQSRSGRGVEEKNSQPPPGIETRSSDRPVHNIPTGNIPKRNWTSPGDVTHNQTDRVLIDKMRHSNILDVQYFKEAECHTDHYLIVAKLRERISVHK